MENELRVYETSAGRAPFNDWLNALKDQVVRVRIKKRLDRLRLGNYGDFKALGKGVLELRIQCWPGYRIYFAQVNPQIVLLLAGVDKNTQEKDILQAQAYWDEFNRRLN